MDTDVSVIINCGAILGAMIIGIAIGYYIGKCFCSYYKEYH